MSFSRRILLSYLGSFVSVPYLFGRCEATGNNVNNDATETAESEIVKILEPQNNLNGFKIVSPEGSKGLCQYNNAGKIISKYMQIVSTDRKLTISDLSWNSYRIDGQVKRWKFDEIEWTTEPLVNFTFSKAYSGKDISIEVAFFPPNNMFYPTKIYQQLIRLG
jgi:hypothetical protein